MQYSKSLIAAAALASVAIASPLARRQQENYRLLVSAPGTAYDGLYVTGYHTGAGTNDLTLTSDDGDYFMNNGTQVTTYLGGTAGPDSTLFSLDIPENTMYDQWYPVTANVGSGTSGFTVGSDGTLVADSSTGFQGWLACDWAHGDLPQLFVSVVPNPALSSNCASITLKEDV